MRDGILWKIIFGKSRAKPRRARAHDLAQRHIAHPIRPRIKQNHYEIELVPAQSSGICPPKIIASPTVPVFRGPIHLALHQAASGKSGSVQRLLPRRGSGIFQARPEWHLVAARQSFQQIDHIVAIRSRHPASPKNCGLSMASQILAMPLRPVPDRMSPSKFQTRRG